jgi:hypothetical protein
MVPRSREKGDVAELPNRGGAAPLNRRPWKRTLKQRDRNENREETRSLPGFALLQKDASDLAQALGRLASQRAR